MKKVARTFSTNVYPRFKNAIVRDIDPSLQVSALSLHPERRSLIDLELANRQHDTLVNVVRSCGVQVVNLASDGYPDSVFIEDTAVIADGRALITKPGADSREGEVTAVRRLLRRNFNDVLTVHETVDGTIDGGDVMFTGNVEFLFSTKIV